MYAHAVPSAPIVRDTFVGAPVPGAPAGDGGATPPLLDGLAPTPGAQVVTLDKASLQGIFRALRGEFPSEAPVGPRQIPSAMPVRLDTYWPTRLPAQNFNFWHRKKSIAGSAAIVAGQKRSTEIEALAPNVGLFLLDVRQFWLQAGLDASDPSALTARPDDWAADGRVGFQLLFDGNPLWDVTENVYDPVSVQSRRVAGWTTLNTNLLDAGQHPTVLYVPENTTITAQWTTAADAPALVPSAVGVALSGYVVPMRTLSGMLGAVRAHGT